MPKVEYDIKGSKKSQDFNQGDLFATANGKAILMRVSTDRYQLFCLASCNRFENSFSVGANIDDIRKAMDDQSIKYIGRVESIQLKIVD